jgi:hypothetical protein
MVLVSECLEALDLTRPALADTGVPGADGQYTLAAKGDLSTSPSELRVFTKDGNPESYPRIVLGTWDGDERPKGIVRG